jgi:hypothetical protein
MKSKKKRSNPVIPEPYLSGEARLEQINREGGDEFVKLYGVNPWFFKNPDLPPPHNKMKTIIQDEFGRRYNFPQDQPNVVHVRLKRAPNLSDGQRRITFPLPGEIVSLADKKQFQVKETIIGQYRVATATLVVEWLT